MKLLRKLFFIVGLLLIIVVPINVAAIDDPTSVRILTAQVFSDVLVEGDQLYVARYDLQYSPVPEEEASKTWELALYDDSGNLIASTPILYYSHYMASIYLKPEWALDEGSASALILRGSPSIFILVEDVNQDTWVLSAGNYYSKDSLGAHILTHAEALEADWEIFLLGGSGLLNSNGAKYLGQAIPGLNNMAPDIYETTYTYLDVDYTIWDTTYQDSLKDNAGAKLKGAIIGIGSIFGISEGGAGLWVASLAWLMVGGLLYGITKNPMISMVGGYAGFTMLGLLGVGGIIFQIASIVLFIVVIMFGLYFILARFA